jgi:hypothetical protein
LKDRIGSGAEQVKGLRIEVEACERIGFVSQQNSVPPLREITLVNETDEPASNLTLSLAADPGILGARTWSIDLIEPGQHLHLMDRDVQIAAGFARELAEAERANISLELRDTEDQLFAQKTLPMTLLAVDDWGGADAMPELLPAFVMPNDPAVEKVLRAASHALSTSGRPDGIDGYESGDRARVYEIVSAIWSAVSGLELTYTLPPASFESRGQKIRSPSAIYSGRVATCLDTALLFAAVIEQAGLHPLIVLTEGHAFAGAWIERDQFSELVTDEVAAVRNRLDLGNIVLFETTMVTGNNRALWRKHPTSIAGRWKLRRSSNARLSPATGSRSGSANCLTLPRATACLTSRKPETFAWNAPIRRRLKICWLMGARSRSCLFPILALAGAMSNFIVIAAARI